MAGGTQAQTEPAVSRERAEFQDWLAHSPTSPFAVLAMQPIGPGISIGDGGRDVPLTGLPLQRVVERGNALTLEANGASRPLPKNRLIAVGPYHLFASGPAGHTILLIYAAAPKSPHPSTYFPYDPKFVFRVHLLSTDSNRVQRVLGPDGIEVDATEVGTVSVLIGGVESRLRVLRIGAAGTEESELEIYFRDGTNDKDTYPAGRFVNLLPGASGGGGYLLDFNRSRNPFCAYSSAFPCPAPWRGNSVRAPIRAGEKYAGGGGSSPPVRPS